MSTNNNAVEEGKANKRQWKFMELAREITCRLVAELANDDSVLALYMKFCDIHGDASYLSMMRREVDIGKLQWHNKYIFW